LLNRILSVLNGYRFVAHYSKQSSERVGAVADVVNNKYAVAHRPMILAGQNKATPSQ
jgi:hypothetical protein